MDATRPAGTPRIPFIVGFIALKGGQAAAHTATAEKRQTSAAKVGPPLDGGAVSTGAVGVGSGRGLGGALLAHGLTGLIGVEGLVPAIIAPSAPGDRATGRVARDCSARVKGSASRGSLPTAILPGPALGALMAGAIVPIRRARRCMQGVIGRTVRKGPKVATPNGSVRVSREGQARRPGRALGGATQRATVHLIIRGAHGPRGVIKGLTGLRGCKPTRSGHGIGGP